MLKQHIFEQKQIPLQRGVGLRCSSDVEAEKQEILLQRGAVCLKEEPIPLQSGAVCLNLECCRACYVEKSC